MWYIPPMKRKEKSAGSRALKQSDLEAVKGGTRSLTEDLAVGSGAGGDGADIKLGHQSNGG